MTQDNCLANAQLVLAERMLHGAVFVEDGRIAGLEEGDHVPVGAIDLDGDVLTPGLIELHTDNMERHIAPRPKVTWPREAAILAHDAELAGCGITTVFDALRVGSVVSTDRTGYGKYARELASELVALRKTGFLKINHHIHLRAEVCSETLIEELDEFSAADGIGILSLMDHTPGQRQFRDLTTLRNYFKGKYALSDTEFAEHIARQKGLQSRLGKAHEAAAVATAKRLGAVLASHDDTTADQVATSARHGVQLAEFPTTLEAAQASNDHGIAVMMCAPNLVRGGSHAGNVSALELAQNDLLDILSSDYIPAGLMLAAFQLAGVWNDLPRAIACVTARPAKAAGLTSRGRIAVGLEADFVRVAVLDGQPLIRETWRGGTRIA